MPHPERSGVDPALLQLFALKFKETAVGLQSQAEGFLQIAETLEEEAEGRRALAAWFREQAQAVTASASMQEECSALAQEALTQMRLSEISLLTPGAFQQ